MSKRTDISFIIRKMKMGAGCGAGASYLPYLTVRDVSGIGIGIRKYWERTGRVHQLLSLLELAAFIFCSSGKVIKGVFDIREQLSIPLIDSIRIAQSLGIRHPGLLHGKPSLRVLTTDLVLTVYDEENCCYRYLPIQVMYKKDLLSKREQSKLKIYKQYWLEQGSELLVFTEDTVPKGLIRNLELLEMASRRWSEEKPLIQGAKLILAEQKLFEAINEWEICLGLTCSRVDKAMNFPGGTSMELLRHQLAIGSWELEDWTIILGRNAIVRVRRVTGVVS